MSDMAAGSPLPPSFSFTPHPVERFIDFSVLVKGYKVKRLEPFDLFISES